VPKKQNPLALSLTRPLNGLAQKGMASDLMVGLTFSKKLLKSCTKFYSDRFLGIVNRFLAIRERLNSTNN
jgi:hypothetical protein